MVSDLIIKWGLFVTSRYANGPSCAPISTEGSMNVVLLESAGISSQNNNAADFAKA